MSQGSQFTIKWLESVYSLMLSEEFSEAYYSGFDSCLKYKGWADNFQATFKTILLLCALWFLERPVGISQRLGINFALLDYFTG